MTELRTGDLLLRAPADADVPDIVAACQDPDIARFLPFIPVPYTEADARGWIAFTQRGWAGELDEKAFAITRAGRLIGAVSLRPGTGSLGYWLAAGERGAGVMPRAVAAVIAWGRAERGLTEFCLTAHPDNTASRRVAEKLGFARAGITHHQPAFRDGSSRAVRFELAAG